MVTLTNQQKFPKGRGEIRGEILEMEQNFPKYSLPHSFVLFFA
jgi:hypothetical protein